MSGDTLNRRTTRAKSATKLPQEPAQAKVEAARAALHKALKEDSFTSSTSTTSEVMTSLYEAMPRMLLRFLVTTIVLGVGSVVFVVLALPSSPLKAATLESEPLGGLHHHSPYRELMTIKMSRSFTKTRTDVPQVQVLAKYPHDSAAFTQGLLVAFQGKNKFFIESTGLYGKSELRKVDIETGTIEVTYALPQEFFGEGVTIDPNGELVLLTWQNGQGFVFNFEGEHFSLARQFPFKTATGEGWGIDSDGTHILVSDGSSTILFWDPTTMQEVRRIDVTYQTHKISHVNELEYANGYIYANVWYQNQIIKIDPQNGQIVSVFDCSALVQDVRADVASGAVLNGIAYDGEEDVFYLTGKLWSSVYKVKLSDSLDE